MFTVTSRPAWATERDPVSEKGGGSGVSKPGMIAHSYNPRTWEAEN